MHDFYKAPYGGRSLHTFFNEVDGYIRKYENNKYLALFYQEKADRMIDRIRYLIKLKSNILNVTSHNMKMLLL